MGRLEARDYARPELVERGLGTGKKHDVATNSGGCDAPLDEILDLKFETQNGGSRFALRLLRAIAGRFLGLLLVFALFARLLFADRL